MYSKEQSPGSRATTAAANGADHSTPPGTGAAEVDRLAKELRGDADRILRGVKRIGFLELKRWNLRVVDIGFDCALYGTAAILALTFAIAGTLLVVSGIRGALAAWLERGWVADLATGVLVLGAIAGAIFAVRARVRRGLLESTKRAMAAMADPVAQSGPQ